MLHPIHTRKVLLALATVLTMTAGPVLAKNDKARDCFKVPAHPDCLYPAEPAHQTIKSAPMVGAAPAPSAPSVTAK